MKILNNRGFLLIETVIVSVFVLSIFLLVYRNSLPIVSMYKNKERYDDIDSIYNVNLFRELINKDGYIYQDIINKVDKEGYVDITDCKVFNSSEELYDNCQTLKNVINIVDDTNKIYVTNWDLSKTGSKGSLLKNKNLNRGLLEYIKYLNDQDEKERNYSYRVILSRTVYSDYEEIEEDNTVSTNRKSTVYYANIGL